MKIQLTVLFALLILSSCAETVKRPTGRPIAKVGNQILTIEDIRRELPDYLLIDDSAKAVNAFKDDWIRRQLLVQEAERIKLHENYDVMQKLQRTRDEVLSQALRDYWLKSTDTVWVSRQEAQAYYEENKSEFVLTERHIRFRHFMTADLPESRAAKEALQRGIAWETVVDRYALDKKETLRNATQFWPISMALTEVPIMHQYLQIIGIREISAIRFIDGRYHFVQLMEQRAKGEHPDVDWVIERISDWLKLEKQRKRLRNFERNLYLKAESNNEIMDYVTGRP